MQPLVLPPLPMLDAVRAAQARGVVLPQVYYGPRQAIHRQVSFTVSRATSLAQVTAMQESLTSALAAGEDFRQWKKRVLANKIDLGLPAFRLETIFRTNVQTAYNAGRDERAERIKRTHPYVLYDAINDARTRPAHRALDGYIGRLDDAATMAKLRCPRGFNCRCRLISITEREAQKRGVGMPYPTNAERDAGFETVTNPVQGALQSLRKAADKARFGNPFQGLPLRPQGNPIQTFVRSAGDVDLEIEGALFSISSVHGHDLAAQVIARKTKEAARWLGLQRQAPGRSLEIIVRDTHHAEFSVVHEVGHALDVTLGARMAGAQAIIQTALKMVAPRVGKSAYLLDPREIWARVYSQWVTERAGSDAARTSLAAMKHMHWTDAEMSILAPLLDSFFLSLGWIKPL